MSFFYFLSRNPCLRCCTNSYKFSNILRISDHYLKTKSQNRYVSNDSSGNDTKESPILHVHSNPFDSDPNPESNFKPGSSYNSMQVRKLIIDNHNNMDIFTLLKHSNTLLDSNMSDSDIVSIISEKLLTNLHRVKDCHFMSMFLRTLVPNSNLQLEFLVKVVNHIYENKIYPYMANPRQWVLYFQFFGSNRVLHTNLYKELLEIFIKYIDLYTNNGKNNYNTHNYNTNNENNNRINKNTDHENNNKLVLENWNKPPLNRRFQESLATACWCLCCCGITNDDLIDRVLKIIDTYNVHPPTTIRIYWTLAILNTRLNRISLDHVKSLLDYELNNNSPHKKSHIHQIYTILMSIKWFKNDINDTNDNTNTNNNNQDNEIDEMINQCYVNLTKFGYFNSGKTISKSQKIISDFLIRCNIPHKFEVITDELISIDISIKLDDVKIALEVDGPVHFLKNIENPKNTRKTETCLHKERLLRKLGWTYISVPVLYPIKNMNLNIQEIDDYYKSILLKYNCSKLNKILKSN